MTSLQELGKTFAERRKALNYRQGTVARQAGLTPETLSRFEKGKLPELGSRKLLAAMAVLGLEMQFVEKGYAGSLDELRKERSAS